MEQIRDGDALTILKRLSHLSGMITEIYWDEMKPGSGDETYMKFVEKQPCALKFLLNTPEGSQYIKLRTESGPEDELLDLIGRKVYARRRTTEGDRGSVLRV